MDQPQSAPRQPIFNAPFIVIALIALLAAVHGLRQSFTPDLEYWTLLHFSFIPARLSETGATLPGGLWVGLTSMFTHAFLHGDWLHFAINSAWLLAFGSMLARRCGVVRFLALFLMSAAAGALFFYVVHPNDVVPLVGASGGVSGLMGAAFRLLFSTRNSTEAWLLRERPDLLPRLPLGQALRDQRVLMATGLWIGVNLLFAFGLSGMLGEGEIAWEAHLGGYFLGFLFLALFDRQPPPLSVFPDEDGDEDEAERV